MIMCGRFVNLNTVEKLDKIFSISKHDNIKYKISYNISPSQLSLIITNFKFLKIENAKWGFNFFDKQRSIDKQIINSRLETIKEKMIFSLFFFECPNTIPIFFGWIFLQSFTTININSGRIGVSTGKHIF